MEPELNDQKSEKNQTVEFNHLIIPAREQKKTADFITNLLDLPQAISADGSNPGLFLCIEFSNNVSILIIDLKDHPIGHYAFKVANNHFDRIVEKLIAGKREFWADPRMQRPFEVYEENGNRGLYIIDPSGHGLEVLTPL